MKKTSPKSSPVQVLQVLQQAIALHNQGRLDEADLAYRQVLKVSPKHPDALHLRALVCHAQAKYQEAATLADAAISIAPRVANLHNTAGEAWRCLGQLANARQRLSEAIRLDPAMAMAHHNLSLVHSAEDQHAQAQQCNQQALSLKPDYVDALVQGVAIGCALNDDRLAAHLVSRLKNFASHAAATPAIARYHVHQARQLMRQLRFADAEQAAQAAIAAQPTFWGGWALAGEASFERLALDKAELFCTMAAHLAPHNQDARLNLATLLVDQQRADEAATHLKDWLLAHPDCANARFSRAALALLRGDYAAGWEHYEARWQLPAAPSRYAAAPQWEGQPVNRLLLYAEQGLGDSVQMLRFMPQVIALCPHGLVLQVPEPLLRLVRRVFGPAGVTVTTSVPSQPFDAACPLMSLPRVLRAHAPEQLLGQSPYLSANAARTVQFSDILARTPGKKLGLIWRGSEGSRANRLRTIPPDALIPLLTMAGWTPVSLQFGTKAPAIAGYPLLDLCDEIADFEDLAAAMQAVDAVVSLDTGPAHLAGALGVSTSTLLPWLHDWRWGMTGEQCPWYASMTLFRQPVAAAWTLPMRQLTERLGGGRLPSPATAQAAASQRPTVIDNSFPFVRINCRYGTFTLPLLDTYITRSMLAYGEYSPREAEVLASYLRPGDTAIDVGANLGTLSLAMARAVGAGGRVIAFEPQSMLHRCLTQTLADSAINWVQARRQAVGAHAGFVKIDSQDPGAAHNFGGTGLTDGSSGEQTELVRLDDLALDACRLIKMDVEGLELQVLQGASSLIALHRPVLCVECDRPGLQDSLVAWLKAQGYRVFRHEPPLFAERNFRQCSANLFAGLVSGNLLGLPPGDCPPADATAV